MKNFSSSMNFFKNRGVGFFLREEAGFRGVGQGFKSEKLQGGEQSGLTALKDFNRPAAVRRGA